MKNRFFLIALTAIALIFVISCIEGIEFYTVSFDSQDGSAVNSVDVAKGLKIGEPITPTRSGYGFLGWFKEKEGINKWDFTHDKVSSNITLYAKWATESYTITYDPNDATGGKAPDPQTKIHGTDLTVESNAGNLVRTDYTFLGWNTKADGSGVDYAPNAVYSIDASATLHAKWIKDNYIITYDANDATAGFVPNSQEKIHGVDLVVRANTGGLERTGYTFSGWNTKADGTGVGYSPGTSYSTDATTTLYAKWIANEYIITYEANGGIPSPATGTVTYGQAYGTLPSVEKTEYTFGGWYTNPDGGGSKVEATTLVTIVANQTLYAKWNKDNYIITYDANSATRGSVPAAQAKQPGVSLELRENTGNLVQTGYQFDGWNTQADGSGTNYAEGAVYVADEKATLFAKWTANKYTVTYQTDGGTPSPENRTVIYGEPYGSQPTVGKTGNTFGGWYTEANGGGFKVENDTTVNIASNHTLYAKWDVITYSVTYDANGATSGTAPTSQVKTHGIELVVKANPGNLSRSGYTFSEWNTKIDGTGTNYERGSSYTIEASATLYAKWIANKYTVTFDPDGGTASLTDKSVTYGQAYGALPNVTKTGHTFGGWFTEASGGGLKIESSTLVNIAGNHTLHAKWTKDDYTITYNSNSATKGTVPTSHKVPHGTEITVKANTGNLERLGYTFSGWNTKSDGSGTDYSPGASYSAEASATLYAKWIIDTFMITYDANGATGGSVPAAQEKNHSVNLVLRENSSNLVRTGYQFDGWNTKSDGSGTSYAVKASYTANADAILFAKWKVNQYEVTYETYGGTPSPAKRSVTYDQAYGPLPVVTKTGYSFSGWHTEANGAGSKIESDTVVKIADNHTLHAKWIAGKYYITYDANGANKGSVPAVQEKTHGEGLIIQGNTGELERSGYTFLKWNTKSDGLGTDYNPGAIYTIDEAATLYVKWAVLTDTAYKVEHYQQAVSGNNYTIVDTDSLLGPTGATATAVSKSYAGFIENKTHGSQVASGTIAADGSLVLKLYYDRETYTVAFDSGGGSTVDPITKVRYDAAITKPADPNRTGYTFASWNKQADLTDGWNFSNDKVTSNTTLYAKWAANEYEVTYEATGGTSSPTKSSVTYNQTYGTLASATKTGYTFDGWYTKADGAGSKVENSTVVNTASSHTLYAKWTPTRYEVMFEAYGGTPSPAKKSVTYDQTYGALPVVTKIGHSFSGWYTEPHGDGSKIADDTKVKVADNHVLYAKWIAGKYGITFVANGATGGNVPAVQEKTHGEDLVIQGNTGELVRTGYTFLKWNTKLDGSGTEYNPGAVYTKDESVTLYAKWSANEYEVTYEASGGTPSSAKGLVTYDQTYGTLASATKTGYTFDGWYTEAEGAGFKVESNTAVNTASSHTLYAKWIANKYAVSFDPDGGTASSTEDKSVTFGQVYGTLPSATKVGHTLDGWYTKADGGGSKVESNTVVDTAYNHTLYAKWNINTYLVTFKDYDGKVLDTQKVNHGRYAIAPSNITRTGHTFTGWDRAFTNVTSDLTITAQYIINTYTVSFESNGGNVVSALTDVKYDSKITKPADPSKTGFTFVGWYKQERLTDEWDFSTDKIASNTILYAKWNAPLGPAGGYIFYDKGEYSDGWRYLEAAPAGWYIEIDPNWEGNDQSETELYDPRKPYGYYRPNGENELVGTNDGIGSGKANTDALVAAMGDEAYSAESGTEKSFYAAKTAKDYSGGGYSDWFLPSKDELDMMYENLYKQGLGGFRYGGAYWSSSEDSSGFAWYQSFSIGDQRDNYRGSGLRVRPVRAF